MEVTQREQIQNPYSRENRAEYRQGKIEKWLHDTLGWRTGVDKYNEEMDNAAKAWETQNQSLAYEEGYNSAEQQVARERAAGINPDLAGDVDPGAAAEMTEPDQMAESPTGIDMDAFSKATEMTARLAAGALDAVTGAAGLYSTIVNTGINIAKNRNEREAEEIEIGSALRNMAVESFGEWKKLGKTDALPGENEWLGKTFGNSGAFMSKLWGLSGRNKKKFIAAYNGLVNSNTAKARELQKQGQITQLASRPEIALPDMYKAIEMLKAKTDAQHYENMLWKAEREAEILNENRALFKGMGVAEMRNVINQAVISGNEAEISKYTKAITALDKLDREAEQKQRNIDRKFISQMDRHMFNNVGDMLKYNDAMTRLYGGRGSNTWDQTGFNGSVSVSGSSGAGAIKKIITRKP